MKALIYEGFVLTAGAIALAYPGYATRYGLPMGGAWRKEGGFIQLAGLSAMGLPLLNMLLRGQGAATVWIYPAALVGAWVAAFALVSVLRHWSQAIALMGVTVGVVVMFAAGRGA